MTEFEFMYYVWLHANVTIILCASSWYIFIEIHLCIVPQLLWLYDDTDIYTQTRVEYIAVEYDKFQPSLHIYMILLLDMPSVESYL